MNDAFQILMPLLATDEPAPLGPQSRPGAWSLLETQAHTGRLLKDAGLSGGAAGLVRSLALLWHDHLDASHAISQGIHSSDGSYLHGIMHRREPDFGNAAYWFHKVGEHPVYAQLASEVTALGADSHFTGRLVNGDRWSPTAMIDACEAVEVGSADDGDAAFLRAVQALEFRLLLERFCSP